MYPTKNAAEDAFQIALDAAEEAGIDVGRARTYGLAGYLTAIHEDRVNSLRFQLKVPYWELHSPERRDSLERYLRGSAANTLAKEIEKHLHVTHSRVEKEDAEIFTFTLVWPEHGQY